MLSNTRYEEVNQTYEQSIARVGGSIQAPINRIRFSCRVLLNTWTYERKQSEKHKFDTKNYVDRDIVGKNVQV